MDDKRCERSSAHLNLKQKTKTLQFKNKKSENLGNLGQFGQFLGKFKIFLKKWKKFGKIRKIRTFGNPANSIHTFTESIPKSGKHFFVIFNGHLNRKKILKEKIQK